MSSLAPFAATRRELASHASILAFFVALFWAVELIDWLLAAPLDIYGIRPRSMDSFGSIFLAPFLHAGFAHLIANTIPFVVLGWFVMIRRTSDFFIVLAISIAVAGMGTWLFGAPRTIHLGASGVVFGFLGFLLLRAAFDRSAVSLAFGIVAGVLYGGTLLSAFPLAQGVSWSGHFFGLVAGGVAARFLSPPRGSAKVVRMH